MPVYKNNAAPVFGVHTAHLPRPITIGIIGLPRSGSTLIYNLVRMMIMFFDPNMISGWCGDIIQFKAITNWVETLHGHNTIVYKAHKISKPLLLHTDFFIFSHRDPYDSICSLGLMFRPEVFTDVITAKRMCHEQYLLQQQLYANISSTKKKMALLDISYSDLADPARRPSIITAISTFLNLTQVPTHFVTSLVSRLSSPNQGMFPTHHPSTLLHANHTHSDSSRCTDLRLVMGDDSLCQSWHAIGGRFHEPKP
jgi:hypothetical protein